MNKLKVGLIGLGGVAEAHLEGYKELDQIEVVSGSCRTKKRLKYMEEKWGFRGYTNYEDMIIKESLDIVCILTPPPSHREITEKVAEHGIHVLCEKPMALSIEDARAMIKKCKKEKVKFFYGETWRFLPVCQEAKKIVETGRLGKISLLIETYVGGRGLDYFRDAGPQHYPIGGPGGGGMGLFDHGIHLIDIFTWLSGSEVISVFGRGNYSGQSPRTEYLTMILKNGATGQLVYNEATFPAEMPYEGIFSWGGSWDIHYNLKLGGGWDDHPQNFKIYGTKGSLRAFHYANKLFYFGETGQKQIPVLDKPMPHNFGMQMESFVKAVSEKKEPEVTAEDGIRALQVCMAAYQSYQTQKIINLPSL